MGDTTQTVTIQGNLISQNQALSANPIQPSNGGGVALITALGVNLVSNDVIENSGQINGGGVYVRGSTGIIGGQPGSADANVITLNKAVAGHGGGVYVEGGNIMVGGNKIIGNEANAGNGGGISTVANYRGIVASNQIVSNQAKRGGGIHVSNALAQIGGLGPKGNAVTSNSASDQAALGTNGAMGIGGGIYIEDSQNRNRVLGNTVGNNAGIGIHIEASSNQIVSNNFVGSNPSGARTPNQGHGISLVDSKDNEIGPGNQIAFNQFSGVSIGSANGIQNKITTNSIHTNAERGIELWSGGNTEIPAPIFVHITPTGATGMAPVQAVAGSKVELFIDADREGRSFVTTSNVGADRLFSFPLGVPITAASTITVIDPNNNTSEFGFGLLNLEVVGVIDSAEMNQPGKVIPINNDDDGFPLGPDNANIFIDTAADHADMAEVRLHKLDSRLNEGSVELELAPSGAGGAPLGVRVFDSAGVPAIGPAVGRNSTVIPQGQIFGAGFLTYRAEGIVPGDYTLSLIYKDRRGKESGRGQVLIKVLGISIDTPGAFPHYVCINKNMNMGSSLIPAGTAGGTFRWSKVSGPGNATFSPAANVEDPAVQFDQPGTYTLKVEYTLGGVTVEETSSNIVAMEVAISQPTAFPAYVCMNEAVQLGSNVVPAAAAGGSYQWSMVSGPSNVNFAPNNTSPNPTFTTTQPGIYVLKVDYTKGTETCTATTGNINVIAVSHIRVTEMNGGTATTNSVRTPPANPGQIWICPSNQFGISFTTNPPGFEANIRPRIRYQVTGIGALPASGSFPNYSGERSGFYTFPYSRAENIRSRGSLIPGKKWRTL